jgi:hypothetical protein
MQRIISPSMLSADFGHLERDTQMIDRSAAEWVHIDVMDGVFVPNISFGFPVMKAIRKATSKLLDVHLMIVEPEKYVTRFAEAGAGILPLRSHAQSQRVHRPDPPRWRQSGRFDQARHVGRSAARHRTPDRPGARHERRAGFRRTVFHARLAGENPGTACHDRRNGIYRSDRSRWRHLCP